MSPPKLLSLNVGLPQAMNYDGATIHTGIFKRPVQGRIKLRFLNFDGDRQADLTVHGGPYKAVYGYPAEHHEFWRKELPEAELGPGAFGENLTTSGLLEQNLHIGDRFQIGSSIVMVRQPRMPCYKLAAKFRRDDLIQKFLHSGLSGFYFSVDQEGDVAEGDSFELISSAASGITIAEMNLLFYQDKYNRGLVEKAMATDALPDTWRQYFATRLRSM